MQVDQRRVLRRARRRLVEPLAVQRQRRAARANQRAARARGRLRAMPQISRRRARRVLAHDRLQRVEARRVRGDEVAVDRARPTAIRCSMPWNSATSVPGSIARCRSAPPAVAVRRGSTTTMLAASGLRAFAASMRRNRIGCAHAVFEPAMNRQSRVVDVLVARRRRVGAERLPCSPRPRSTCTAASWCRCCWCRPAPWRAC